jgi:hypothetical protein
LWIWELWKSVSVARTHAFLSGLSVPLTLGPFLSKREHFHRQDTPRFMRA